MRLSQLLCRGLWSVALLSVLHGSAALAAGETPIVVGTRITLTSKVLGEERPLMIHLPGGYEAAPTERYPVLYVLDAETHFVHVAGMVEFLARTRHLPEMIVVGVPNTTDRDRDLTPPFSKTERIDDGRLLSEVAPKAGHADTFLRFFTEELAPAVEARYRTQPYRILVGHSFGGLFAMHVLTHKPESFNAYVAISPSIQWNSSELLRTAPEAFARLAAPGRALYLYEDAEEAPNVARLRTLTQELRRRKPANLTWRYDELRGQDDHASIPHIGAYEGLRFLFNGWKVPEKLQMAGDLARLEAHYAGLSRRVGYPVVPQERLFNGVGYHHLKGKRLPQAIAAFERNVSLHPDSANAHDSLADALEAAGRLQEALTHRERAVSLAREHQDPDLPHYQKHADELRARLAAQPAP
ncbi:Ferri-bacillibactin esterase BesA [Corallococcus coralloides DSM 2259]|uniref:Ferri-bacillibactin esterase BesA n=1 Tax=Corallococcus coralloides (strain ATCC 25202 / DSM 2259 / NBRC 100086 / M2) TaxID=1144275 RepID=H8MYE7_CORCM|nr:alpha/beta hydrolase-fold protein [Corallococcus coralloides]AFE08189.1 Ferri-bacillibactin esterase BesA [Corallococcus coralloides DSM 2259]